MNARRLSFQAPALAESPQEFLGVFNPEDFIRREESGRGLPNKAKLPGFIYLRVTVEYSTVTRPCSFVSHAPAF